MCMHIVISSNLFSESVWQEVQKSLTPNSLDRLLGTLWFCNASVHSFSSIMRLRLRLLCSGSSLISINTSESSFNEKLIRISPLPDRLGEKWPGDPKEAQK